jgi:hypothetical protein
MSKLAIRSSDIVSARIDGKYIVWSAGEFTGDETIVAVARSAAEQALSVNINGEPISASHTDPVGAFAAIYSINPDKTVVIEAPQPALSVAKIGISWDNPDSWG